jgi:DNA-binding NarL/FixJ family response regulator
MADLRIGLIDGNELVRSGRAMVFNSQIDMRVVLEESDPVVAIERAPDYLVDVLLVGPSQHRLRGEQFIQTLTKARRDAGNDCAVVAYNSFTTPKLRFEAIKSGAHEFVGLDTPASELLTLVRKVVKSDFVVEPAELYSLAAAHGALEGSQQLELKLAELTDIQTEMVTLFLTGANDLAISKKLDAARTRVSNLLSSLMASAGVSTRNQLVLALAGRPA